MRRQVALTFGIRSTRKALPAPGDNLRVAIGIVASGRARRTYNAGVRSSSTARDDRLRVTGGRHGEKAADSLLVRDRCGALDAAHPKSLSAEHQADADSLQSFRDPARCQQGQRGRDNPEPYPGYPEGGGARWSEGLCHDTGAAARTCRKPDQARGYL